jgi:hypothetical protein
MGDGFDYAAEFATLDLDAVHADIVAVMTTSQEWWPSSLIRRCWTWGGGSWLWSPPFDVAFGFHVVGVSRHTPRAAWSQPACPGAWWAAPSASSPASASSVRFGASAAVSLAAAVVWAVLPLRPGRRRTAGRSLP